MSDQALFVGDHGAPAPRRSPIVQLPLPRLGLLGAPWSDGGPFESFAHSATADVVALFDPEGRTEAARRAAPHVALASSLDELLDRDLDGLVIAAPGCHAAAAIAALERGLPVLCQAPLGCAAPEVEAVVRAARVMDRLLMLDFRYRFTEAMRRIRELVSLGEMGTVFAVETAFHDGHASGDPWSRPTPGGCLLDLGTHLVDLVLWTLGFPRVVAASGRRMAKGVTLLPGAEGSEDYAAGRLDLEGGTSVQLACSSRQAGGDSRVEISFHGTRAWAGVRNVGGSRHDFRADWLCGRRRQTLSVPPDPWPPRSALEFARRVQADPHFDPEAERLVDVAAVLDALGGRTDAGEQLCTS